MLDNRIINDFKVKNVRISKAENPVDRWHLYEVEADEQQIDVLSRNLKPRGWYVHFWRNDDIIVVFPHRKFLTTHTDKTTRNKAIAYGISIGIPKEQLDFPKDGS